MSRRGFLAGVIALGLSSLAKQREDGDEYGLFLPLILWSVPDRGACIPFRLGISRLDSGHMLGCR